MEVRKYQEADRRGLVELWRAVFPDNSPHNEPEKMIDAKLLIDDLIFVAVKAEGVIGACMAGYDGHRGWLYAVAVSPTCRGHGVGRLLISKAEQALHELGCIKINLQIRSDNAEVQRFYESIGYTTEPRISMGKRLTPGE